MALHLDQKGIRQLIATSDKAVLRALVAIYRKQTASERSAFTTIENNGVGFSASDASTCSRYAKIALTQGWLPAPDVEKLRPVMMKYSRQLLQIAVSNELNNLCTTEGELSC